jgi:AhpD family alkylhydroperoxidase
MIPVAVSAINGCEDLYSHSAGTLRALRRKVTQTRDR